MLEENFAFASPRGTITRWGAGAAVLFGMSGEDVAGRAIFEAVLAEGDGGWRALLEGEADSAQRMISLELGRSDGQTFPCEVRFLPVALADGLDFSSFSSDLRADRPMDESQELLRSRHPHVVELLEGAEDGDEPVKPDGPLAGLVVTFRSSAPPPVTPDRRLEEALERTEREVEDIRAPVNRLETQVGGLAAQVEQAFQAMAELRADIRRALAALPAASGVNPNGDPDEPARPARPGFDDAAVPMATLTLQGNFMELNPGFRELVGYSEELFASARWPSNVDRTRLAEHTELRERLAAGEIEGEHVEVAYMHSAGLVVELSGRMSLVRTSNGAPDHLLLTLDVR
jgi:PAS domain S-box-containing protein